MFTEVEGSLSGKKIALFGSWGWGQGAWMTDWEGRCLADGAVLACDSVTCNNAPDDDAIAACGAMAMLLTQTALNVFGTMDLLPFTGVTFPFVSRGGSSLLSCWMLMAFLKGSDTRRDASFVVNPVRVIPGTGEGKAKA